MMEAIKNNLSEAESETPGYENGFIYLKDLLEA